MGNYQNQPKKMNVNKVELTGILRPRSSGEQDPIQVYNFSNGGAIVHVIVKTEDPTGTFDENGNPKVERSSIPVDISTNKSITAQMLSGLVSGMKVHVVGKLKNKSYDDKKTGTKVNTMVVAAFVLDILQAAAAPMPAYGQQMPPYGQQAPVPQMPPYYAQQQPMPAYGQAPAPQQMPPAPAQAPVPPYYAAPAPQTAPQGQQYPPMPAQAPAPQYPPQYQQQYQQQAPAPVVEDLP